MSVDEKYMLRCLDLAKMGLGSVSPNPMVGCVIVREDIILAEGYTSPYGGPHAEVNAVNNLFADYGQEKGETLLKESTVYVSLEPCAHYGKTPPCAELLAKYKPKRVVVACQDPYEKVSGKGIQILRDAGIECEIGVLEGDAKWMNRRFFTKVEKHRPYIILKWAETKDGFFAPDTAQKKWITNEASRQWVHKWRTEEDAILVGKNTAMIDNPSLTAREWEGKNPLRVLIDKRMEVPLDSAIFDHSAQTIVFNAVRFDQKENVRWLELENFDFYLPQTIVYQLYLMDIQSIIVEGGVRTLEGFIEAGLWDEARILSSAEMWGEGKRAPEVSGKIIEDIKLAGNRLRVIQKR